MDHTRCVSTFSSCTICCTDHSVSCGPKRTPTVSAFDFLPVFYACLCVFVRLCTQCCLGSKSATWGWELLVMAGREHSVEAACSDGDSHLEERLWLSFASKQSNKSLWRLTAELRYRGEQLQANKYLLSFEEGTFFLVSLWIFLCLVFSSAGSRLRVASKLCLSPGSSFCIFWRSGSSCSLH